MSALVRVEEPVIAKKKPNAKLRMLRKRDFPTNYPSDAVRILRTMSFGKGLLLVGSMAIRSQLYAGDYDGFEVVKCEQKTKTACLTHLRKRFQEIVAEIQRLPNVFLGDIKAVKDLAFLINWGL